MDEYFELPSRKDDVPSLLSISETYSIVGRGTVVSGILEKGVVKKVREAVCRKKCVQKNCARLAGACLCDSVKVFATLLMSL